MTTLIQIKDHFPLKVTDLAIEKLLAARDRDEDFDDTYSVRVVCEAGGCAGFKQSLDFMNEIKQDDLSTQALLDGKVIYIVIDPESAKYMAGVTLDYEVSAWEEGFKFIGGDNLKGTCSCGASTSYCS